jgi:N-acetylglutamate synthase-like GNAT family acetyltransferase
VDVVITPARPGDLDGVLALLEAATLPRDGVAQHFGDFLVARAGGVLVGAAGLERHGDSVLLRSLVVSPAERGRGLGRELAERVLERARALGARRASC